MFVLVKDVSSLELNCHSLAASENKVKMSAKGKRNRKMN